MKNILFITDSQFGYNSDLFYYSKYLAKRFNITFLSINHDFPTIKPDSKIKLIEVKSGKKNLNNKFNLIKKIFQLNRSQNYDFIFVLYFPLCSLIQLFVNRKKSAVDIRSSYIIPNNKLKQYFSNTLMKFEYNTFINRTIISSSLANFLNIKVKYYVLPLGGELNKVINNQLLYTKFKLLYIGTFYERDIYKTILGFKMFIDKNPKIKISYTLIGFGSENDIKTIQELIINLNLQDYIKYLGEIRYPDNLKYFEECNIGVSFVPCTKYYDCQPPTKTFEYLLSGMPVIATNTTENKLVINERNGIVTNDNPIDFCEAIKSIISRNYNNIEIQKNSMQYCWENIVENRFIPFIQEVLDCTHD